MKKLFRKFIVFYLTVHYWTDKATGEHSAMWNHRVDILQWMEDKLDITIFYYEYGSSDAQRRFRTGAAHWFRVWVFFAVVLILSTVLSRYLIGGF
jgi:hypothetical protein